MVPHTGPALQVTQALFWQIWLDDWQQLAPQAKVPEAHALTQAPFWQVWPTPQQVDPHTGPALQVTQALFWQTWLDDWQQLAPHAKVPAPQALTQAPFWQVWPAPQQVDPHFGPALQVTQEPSAQICVAVAQQLVPSQENVPVPQGTAQAPLWQVWPDGQHSAPQGVVGGVQVALSSQKPRLLQVWSASQQTGPQTVAGGVQVALSTHAPLTQLWVALQQLEPQIVEGAGHLSTQAPPTQFWALVQQFAPQVVVGGVQVALFTHAPFTQVCEVVQQFAPHAIVGGVQVALFTHTPLAQVWLVVQQFAPHAVAGAVQDVFSTHEPLTQAWVEVQQLAPQVVVGDWQVALFTHTPLAQLCTLLQQTGPQGEPGGTQLVLATQTPPEQVWDAVQQVAPQGEWPVAQETLATQVPLTEQVWLAAQHDGPHDRSFGLQATFASQRPRMQLWSALQQPVPHTRWSALQTTARHLSLLQYFPAGQLPHELPQGSSPHSWSAAHSHLMHLPLRQVSFSLLPQQPAPHLCVEEHPASGIATPASISGTGVEPQAARKASVTVRAMRIKGFIVVPLGCSAGPAGEKGGTLAPPCDEVPLRRGERESASNRRPASAGRTASRPNFSHHTPDTAPFQTGA